MRLFVTVALLGLLGAGSLGFGYALNPSGPDATQVPLRVALSQWPVYQLLRYAQSEGRLDPSRVRLMSYHSTADQLRSYRIGRADAIALTGQHLAAVDSDTDPGRIVFVMDESRGGDALIAGPEIRTLAGLAGRRIALEADPLAAYMLRRALGEADLSLSDVSTVFLELADHRAALEAGEVEAAITYEPYLGELIRELGMHPLLDSRAMPGEIRDVLMVRERILRAQPELDRTLAEAWDWAVGRVREDPEQVYRALAAELHMDEAAVAQAFARVTLFDHTQGRGLLAEDSPAYHASEQGSGTAPIPVTSSHHTPRHVTPCHGTEKGS